MSNLNPEKLHVRWMEFDGKYSQHFPRCYTLTHSDRTGDLFLTIGPDFDHAQISGFYTRLMRDEVLAKWKLEGENRGLHVHLHVSGGITLGAASWRDSIFRHHLPMVLQAFRYGDPIFNQFPELDLLSVHVHFHANRTAYDRVEILGVIGDYRMLSQA